MGRCRAASRLDPGTPAGCGAGGSPPPVHGPGGAASLTRTTAGYPAIKPRGPVRSRRGSVVVIIIVALVAVIGVVISVIIGVVISVVISVVVGAARFSEESRDVGGPIADAPIDAEVGKVGI